MLCGRININSHKIQLYLLVLERNLICNKYIEISTINQLQLLKVDRFCIKEKLEENVIVVPHVCSEDQLVNIITKVVSNMIFSQFICKLGVFSMYAPT